MSNDTYYTSQTGAYPIIPGTRKIIRDLLDSLAVLNPAFDEITITSSPSSRDTVSMHCNSEQVTYLDRVDTLSHIQTPEELESALKDLDWAIDTLMGVAKKYKGEVEDRDYILSETHNKVAGYINLLPLFALATRIPDDVKGVTVSVLNVALSYDGALPVTRRGDYSHTGKRVKSYDLTCRMDAPVDNLWNIHSW